MTVALVRGGSGAARAVGRAGRRAVRRRLARVRGRRERPARPAGDRPAVAAGASRGAVGLAVAGLVGAWWGDRGRGRGGGRRPSGSCGGGNRPRSGGSGCAATADLPLGADLLAAALRAGAPVDRAAAAVAEALGGPLGERLERDGAFAAARRPAGRGVGPPRRRAPGRDRLVAAAVRSSASGGALAGALGRLADDLRADRAVAAEAAAQRAGVLIVLPLGLCFLPAFLLAGLVPVLIAVLGDVL